VARQELLGQRRTLIGQVRLVADQHQPARETLAAQSIDGLGSRLSAAEDRYGRIHGFLLDPSSRDRNRTGMDKVPTTVFPHGCRDRRSTLYQLTVPVERPSL